MTFLEAQVNCKLALMGIFCTFSQQSKNLGQNNSWIGSVLFASVTNSRKIERGRVKDYWFSATNTLFELPVTVVKFSMAKCILESL